MRYDPKSGKLSKLLCTLGNLGECYTLQEREISAPIHIELNGQGEKYIRRMIEGVERAILVPGVSWWVQTFVCHICRDSVVGKGVG
jgi:hypothetical protein